MIVFWIPARPASSSAFARSPGQLLPSASANFCGLAKAACAWAKAAFASVGCFAPGGGVHGASSLLLGAGQYVPVPWRWPRRLRGLLGDLVSALRIGQFFLAVGQRIVAVSFWAVASAISWRVAVGQRFRVAGWFYLSLDRGRFGIVSRLRLAARFRRACALLIRFAEQSCDLFTPELRRLRLASRPRQPRRWPR